MANTTLLNNIDHKDLRVITDRSAMYGDSVMTAIAFAPEFRNLQAHYPIVFYKVDDGARFESAALLGFEVGENLFLDSDAWDAAHIPMSLQRQPFSIGTAGSEKVIHVDMASPRLSNTEGEPLFLEYGGTTEYLERMNSILLALHQGVEGAEDFHAALLSLNLLEPFVFDVPLADGAQHRLVGFYTINEERLNALEGDLLERLNKSGYLQPIYMVIASMSNLRELAARKIRKHAAQT